MHFLTIPNVFTLQRSALHITLQYVILFICILLVFIASANEALPLRYIKYLIPFCVIGALAFKKKVTLYLSKTSFPFIFLVLWAALNMMHLNTYGLKDMFFIFTGFVFFLFFKIDKINYVLVNIFFILIVLIFQFNNFNFTPTRFSLATSESFVIKENNLATLFGIFALIAYFRKNYLFLLINLLFMVIDMKRMALGAFALTLLFALAPKRLHAYILQPVPMVCVNFFLIWLIFQISDHTFDPFLQKTIGMHSSWIVQGRDYYFEGVVTDIKTNGLLALLFGAGAGQAYTAASKIVHEFVNLHSDILKVFYEYGIFGFVTFFLLLYNSKNNKARLLAFYFNFSLLLDNVLIFSHVIFLYLLAVSMIEKNEVKAAVLSSDSLITADRFSPAR